MTTVQTSIPWSKRLTIIGLILLLSACESMNARQIGGIVGGVAGAIGGSYLGSYVGDTAGSIVGSILGSVAGSLIGAEIGGYLGKNDKKNMAEASQKAFDTGETHTFSNPDSGVSGRAEVVPASETAQQTPTGNCKTIRQTVTLKDGSTHTEDLKSCK